jgi:NAD+ synthase (glutamine-hydrolysing)
MKSYGYFRAAAAAPVVKPGAVESNLSVLREVYQEAAQRGAEVVLFPEMAVTGYTCADLFSHSALISASRRAVLDLAGSTSQGPLMVVGAPLELAGLLYNAAFVLGEGRILGAVPKTYLPNAREFYEQRWFASGFEVDAELTWDDQTFPVSPDILFTSSGDSGLTLAVEVCEDLWAVVPPSGRHALAGAKLILNPSASNELVGKSEYRRDLVKQQSARILGGYLYASAGVGESTTDTVFGGHLVAAENGTLLGEGLRFSRRSELALWDFDMDFLAHERMVSATYRQGVELEGARISGLYRMVSFQGIGAVKAGTSPSPPLLRPLPRKPFVPSDPRVREARCREIFSIQSAGLASRLAHLNCRDVVIGLSGGLDSTLALLVAVHAFDELGLDKKGIHCYTMPGFGTTGRTRGNAGRLCEFLGIPVEVVDIQEVSRLQLKELNHSGEPSDTAYENVQARQRTMFLMNKSNMLGGLVVGTGDLSELALGWCTYNGDHMSMYAVNTGVPKTLVTYLVEYVADTLGDQNVSAVLRDIIETPISPELLPPDQTGGIAQKTEELVGPYELHDFFLYYLVRCGYSPSKVLFLAGAAFESDGENPAYKAETILKWLKIFIRRFFSQQFKRSCLPDGPKVGTIALSPRGDWRMPSDASPELWLADLEGL